MSIILDGSTGISSIGTLTGVTSISSAAANTPVVMQDSGSNTNTCRAWINLNGTLAAASMIRASFNVTSITDNGVGDYTINFTTAMPDANYSLVATNSRFDGNAGAVYPRGVTPFTTTTARIQSIDNDTNTVQDALFMCVAIFR